MKREQRVYFLRPVGSAGPVKIGCSEMPWRRLKDLAAWSPHPLELVVTIPGDYVVERQIHEALADLHSHKEWFRADPRIDDLMVKLLAGVPLEAAIDLAPRGYGESKKAQHYARNPEARLRCSYSHRLSWADRKRYKAGSRWTPDDIEAIMHRWQGRFGAEQRPTDAEFARLEAYIANPLAEAAPDLAAAA